MIPPAAAAVALMAAAAILIRRFPSKGFRIATLSLILATPLCLIGFWYSTGKLGISDWDYYFSYHHVLRASLLEHGAFPFWNPYTCGGTAGLADPEFPLFTPTFLLELIFGIPAGLRLAIIFATTVTSLGMLALARRLGLSAHAALIAALAGAFGSVSLLEIVEGHPNVFAAMWLPWVFWAWIAAYNNSPLIRGDRGAHAAANRWSLLTGLFLALTFYQGGVYLLSYTALAFLIVILLAPRRLTAFRITLQAGIWALALAAVKLIPAILWLQQFQDTAYASSTYTLPYLHEILLGRNLHNAGDIIPNQGSGWHEYGAYLGVPILVLSLIGAIAGRRRRVVKILTLGAILALLLSSAGPLLKPLFDAAPFIPRSNISRIILFSTLPLSLLAGFGLDVFKRVKPPLIRGARGVPALASILLLTIVATDLFTLANALSYQAFVLPDVYPSPSSAPSPIAYTTLTYETRHNGHDYTRAYAATRAGYGTLSYCSVLTPEPAVRTIHDEGDNGVIATSSKAATTELISWSPNEVTTHIATTEPTDILLNTNYAAGWHTTLSPSDEGETKRGWVPARDIAGRVGTSLPSGQHTLTFRYRTPGFIPGLTLSLLALLLASITGIRAATDVIKRRRALPRKTEVDVVL